MALLDSAPMGLRGKGLVVLLGGLGLAVMMDAEVASELRDVTGEGISVSAEGVALQEQPDGYEIWQVHADADDVGADRPSCTISAGGEEHEVLAAEFDDAVHRGGAAYEARYTTAGALPAGARLTCTGEAGSMWVVPADEVRPEAPRALREVGLVAGGLGGAAAAVGAAGALRRRRQAAEHGFSPTAAEVMGADRLHADRPPEDDPSPLPGDTRQRPAAPPPPPRTTTAPAAVDPDVWPASQAAPPGYVFPAPPPHDAGEEPPPGHDWSEEPQHGSDGQSR